MDVINLYQQMLKPPAPWQVYRVEVAETPKRVDVWLEHAPSLSWPCPDCDHSCPVYDHTEERAWRHLNTCNYETWVHARLPRVICPDHGIRQVVGPVAGPRTHMTTLMETWCIDVLQECSKEGAVRLSSLTWDQLDLVMAHSVERGMLRRIPELPEWLGLDEKSVFARHKYFTIIADLTGGRVIDVLDKRTIDAVEPWFAARKELLASVKGIAMDMSAGYESVVRSQVPHAEICFDHFHVTQLVTKAVDSVRKQEQKSICEEDSRTDFFRSRYLFLYNAENVPEHRTEQFERLKAVAVKTSRAWAIKENIRDLWNCTTPERASQFFKRWYWWATHSRLEPIRKAAHSLKDHWQGIANAIDRRISNACTEGLNNKIERIKRDACGFRSKERFRTAILFHCGDLSLYPDPIPS